MVRPLFISLIPCPQTPRDDREKTERRAGKLLHDFLRKSLHISEKKCNFAVEINSTYKV